MSPFYIERGQFENTKSLPAATCGLLLLRYNGGNVVGVYAIDAYNTTQIKQADGITVSVDNRVVKVTGTSLPVMYALISIHA